MKYATLALILQLVFSSAHLAQSGGKPSAAQQSQNTKAQSAFISAKSYSFKIIRVYPHDSQAFTQGLVFDEGVLYEGTGIRGKSELRRIKLDTGELLHGIKLQDRYFGEGTTVFGNKLIQLTWTSKTGFVYDKNNFGLIKTFHYTTEGWGLTHDGKRLIMSDGTAILYFLNPETYQMTGQIEVNDNNGPVTRLNELEYIRGEIYANIWQTDNIAIINPDTGRVTGWIDLESLTQLAGGDKATKTLNGIAYDKETDRLFVTGKLWPKIYEIKIIP
ncbi:MAG: glutaminyl-peptide cyclotransferase [Nitrospirae bacterium]|nr:glutaminyl-peptide cyclotransferase [Nitrospirota bacterium]